MSTSGEVDSILSTLPPPKDVPEPLICLAFKFDDRILYIGDVNEIPPRTWERLQQPNTPPLDILIVDALWPLRSHASHYSLAQALSTALRLNPSITYLTGVTHPISHYMWEYICASLLPKIPIPPDHPCTEQAEDLVRRLRSDPEYKGPNALIEQLKDWEGGVEPGWDGLVLQVAGEEGWKVVEGREGTARGWGI